MCLTLYSTSVSACQSSFDPYEAGQDAADAVPRVDGQVGGAGDPLVPRLCPREGLPRTATGNHWHRPALLADFRTQEPVQEVSVPQYELLSASLDDQGDV